MDDDTAADETKRLTKKQKKALQHRQGGGNKGAAAKRKAAIAAAIPDTPEADLLDEDAPAAQKRKLPSAEEEAVEEPAQKKRKKTAWDEAEEDKPAKSKPRLICFVGNLPYKVDQGQIASHFAAQCGETPTVRLLTPKTPSDTKKPSKGCAFVEFEAPAAMQHALKLHLSQLGGRKINVELTAGGGGKGEQRQAKLAKNKARLDAQRVKKAPDAASTEKKDGDKAALSKNAKRRGKDAGGEAKERKPKVKKERKPFKPQLSGANAMRLG